MRTLELRLAVSPELGVELGVTIPHHVGFVVFGEAFFAVLADRLEEPVAGLGRVAFARPPASWSPSAARSVDTATRWIGRFSRTHSNDHVAGASTGEDQLAGC